MAGPTYIVTERLARTVDGRIVPYEHPEAAFLAYRPGDSMPLAEAQAAGLHGAKEVAAGEDKMVATPAEDKTAAVAGRIMPPESRRQPAPDRKGKR